MSPVGYGRLRGNCNHETLASNRPGAKKLIRSLSGVKSGNHLAADSAILARGDKRNH